MNKRLKKKLNNLKHFCKRPHFNTFHILDGVQNLFWIRYNCTTVQKGREMTRIFIMISSGTSAKQDFNILEGAPLHVFGGVSVFVTLGLKSEPQILLLHCTRWKCWFWYWVSSHVFIGIYLQEIPQKPQNGYAVNLVPWYFGILWGGCTWCKYSKSLQWHTH